MELVRKRGFITPNLSLMFMDLCMPAATKNTFTHCTLFNHPDNISNLVSEGREGLAEGLNLIANLFCEESLTDFENMFGVLLFIKITINNKTYTKLEEEMIDEFCIYGTAALHWSGRDNPQNYAITFVEQED